jgi:hypothetical protein
MDVKIKETCTVKQHHAEKYEFGKMFRSSNAAIKNIAG